MSSSSSSTKSKDHSDLFREYVLACLGILRKMPNLDGQILKRCRAKFLRTERSTYIQYTLTNLTPHIKHICTRDISIFGDDYIRGPLYLLVGVDFKKVWAAGPTQQEQDDIFKSLQLVFIYASLALHTNKSLVKEMVLDMKMQAELAKEIEEAEEKDAERQAGGGLGGGLDFSALLGNNPMLEIMKEIIEDPELTETLNLPLNDPQAMAAQMQQTGQNPIQMLSSLFTPDRLQNFLTTFQSKMEEKMVEKNMTEEDLQSQTQSLNSTVMDSFQNNPLLKSMGLDQVFQNLNQTLEQSAAQMQQSQSQQQTNSTGLPTQANPEQITQLSQNLQSLVQDIGQRLPGDVNQMNTQLNQAFQQFPHMASPPQPPVQQPQPAQTTAFEEDIEDEFEQLKNQ